MIEGDGSAAAADQSTAEAEADADARALASVLRMRILRLCLDEALTNKEIAERLGRPPATTFHHVRTLAERGFLTAQPERRGTRGAREVPYLATRKSWRTRGVPGGDRVLVDTFLEELAEAPEESVDIARLGMRLAPEAYDRLRARLIDLLQEYADREPDPDGTPISLFIALHEDTARRRPSGGAS